MKRFSNVILVAIIFALMTTSVFAETSSERKIYNNAYAIKLKELGLFSGTDKGFELEKSMPRVQGAVMLVRILGKEAEAKADPQAHPFTDVPEWADAHVGYLYANGLSNGLGEGKYGSDELMSGDQFMTLLLRALKYKDSEGDFAWDKSLTKAKDLGILTDEEVNRILSRDEFLRDDMVLLAYKAIEAKYKEQDETLGLNLYKAGVLNKKSVKNIKLKGVVETLGVTVKIEKGSDKENFIVTIPKEKLDGEQKNFTYMDIVPKTVMPSDDEIYKISVNKNLTEIAQKEEYKISGKSMIILYDDEGNPLGTSDIFTTDDISEDAVVIDFLEFKYKEYRDNIKKVMLSTKKFDQPLISFSVDGMMTITTDKSIENADKIVLAEVDSNWNSNVDSFIEASVAVKSKAQETMSLPLNGEAQITSVKEYFLKGLTENSLAFLVSKDKEILGYSSIDPEGYKYFQAYEKVDKSIKYIDNALYIFEYQYDTSYSHYGYLNIGELNFDFDEYNVYPLYSLADIPLYLAKEASTSYGMKKKHEMSFYADQYDSKEGYLAMFLKDDKTVGYSYIAKEDYLKDSSKIKSMTINFAEAVTEDQVKANLKYEISYKGKVISTVDYNRTYHSFSGLDSAVIRNMTIYKFLILDNDYSYKPIGNENLKIQSYKMNKEY